MIADLYDWDDALRAAVARRKLDAEFGNDTKIDRTEGQQARRAARENLALVEFMAPEEVAGQARYAVMIREQVQVFGLEPAPGSKHVDIAELDKQWKRAFESRTALKNAMRNDLGIET